MPNPDLAAIIASLPPLTFAPTAEAPADLLRWYIVAPGGDGDVSDWVIAHRLEDGWYADDALSRQPLVCAELPDSPFRLRGEHEGLTEDAPPEADDFDTDACAALEFEKLSDGELRRQFNAAPWKKECADAGITLRLAAVTMEKTKEELVEVVRGLGTDNYFELEEHFHAQAERFSQLAALLKSASARLMIAMSAVAVEVEGPAEPVRGFGPIL